MQDLMGPHQTSQVLARPRSTSRYIAGLRPTSQDLARRRRTSPILLVNSMEFCLSSMAIPWNFFKFHGILLQFKKDLVNLIKFHGILVNSMEFCSVPWPFHGILFKFHGTLLQFKKFKVEPVYSVHNNLSEVSKKVHRVTLQYSSVN